MKREIYEVHMSVVDANGTLTIDPTGYPKKVDSMSYENDTDKALKRAKGLLGEIEKNMSTQDTREIQYGYIIRVSDGLQIEKRLFGKLKDLPDPEPEEEEEPEPEVPSTEPEGGDNTEGGES